MGQPISIRLFTYLLLGSLVISALADAWFFDRTLAEVMDASAGIGNMIVGQSVIVLAWATLAASYALLFVLWWFITNKRSKIAKWIFTTLTVLYCASMIAFFEEYPSDEWAPYMVVAVLQSLAAGLLFRRDARDWFARRDAVDTEVFE